MSTLTINDEKPTLCFQCAKCSAGCPVVDEMDILPHALMHLTAMGRREQALRSKTIWICAGCFTCAVRCPNDIDITTVMDGLREEAVARDLPCPLPDVKRFHENFLADVRRRGRIHELRMMGEYNLKSLRPFRDWQLALGMFLRGRLSLLPPRSVKGFRRWLADLWKQKR